MGSLIFLAVFFAVAGADIPAAVPDATAAKTDVNSSNSASLEVVATTLDGGTVSGTLSQLSNGQITIRADGKNTTLNINQLLSVAPQKLPEAAAETAAVWIELVDGSKLTGTAFTMKKAMADITIAGEVCQVPTSAIRTVRFSKPGEPGSTAWPAKVGAEASSDLLAVRKKDAVDFDEGVLESVDEHHVVFQIDGEAVPVSRAKVDGLIFFHKTGDTLAEPTCVIDTAEGWRLKANQISLSGRRLNIKTTSGQTFLIPLDGVAKLDYSSGKLVYLSDLEPESVRWTPYLDFHKATTALQQFYAPRRDEGLEHRPLLVRGKTYAKGWALYSRTEMTFRLPTGAKTFKALAGIDDSVRETGGVRLQISADGKKLFDKAISGSEEPADIDLDIAGAKRLTILVDYGAGLDAGDYLNLADARILK